MSVEFSAIRKHGRRAPFCEWQAARPWATRNEGSSPPFAQIPLGSIARSGLAKLVPAISLPGRLTEKGLLAVHNFDKLHETLSSVTSHVCGISTVYTVSC